MMTHRRSLEIRTLSCEYASPKVVSLGTDIPVPWNRILIQGLRHIQAPSTDLGTPYRQASIDRLIERLVGENCHRFAFAESLKRGSNSVSLGRMKNTRHAQVYP